MVVFKHKGNFSKTERFLKGSEKIRYDTILTKYAEEGIRALAAATPKNSGVTADSWGYTIRSTKGSHVISFTNSHVIQGFSIVIGIQYGHGTRNGGYVQGQDFINPAIQPVFDRIADAAWQEVSSL